MTPTTDATADFEPRATLAPFVEAGVLGEAEVHFAATLAGEGVGCSPPPPAEVLLAAALAVRAPRHGSVCVDLDAVAGAVVASVEEARSPATGGAAVGVEAVADLRWPTVGRWVKALAASPLVHDVARSALDLDGRRPLVLDGRRLYLARYHGLERLLARLLRERAARIDAAPAPVAPTGLAAPTASTGAAPVDPATASTADGSASRDPVVAEAEATAIGSVFDSAGDEGGVDADQGAAARAVTETGFVVVVGGPGTGKTTTVARMLAGLVVADPTMSIALAAPTGKAAARMTEALRTAVNGLTSSLGPEARAALAGMEATTIHRLLGRPDTPWGHGPHRRLPHDLVVVDEASMVSLSLMAHLVSSVRDDARVVLVGDPDQLASVEAGSVLADVVDPRATALAAAVRPLRRFHRQEEGSRILDLAAAVRAGDVETVLGVLRDGDDVTWIEPDAAPEAVAALADEVVGVARSVVEHARRGEVDAAIEALAATKVLCAHRRGPAGVEGWNRRTEGTLRAEGLVGWSDWYEGRPVMVTENDPLNGVFNGDVGVARLDGDVFAAWFPRAEGPLKIDSVRLDRVATQWAMSIHKSQGSEFDHVVVVLPAPPARILTRELLYTAVTRARRRLTLVATESAVRSAVGRPVARSSGLVDRLR